MVQVCQRGRQVRKKKCVFFATLTNFVVFLQQNGLEGLIYRVLFITAVRAELVEAYFLIEDFDRLSPNGGGLSCV